MSLRSRLVFGAAAAVALAVIAASAFGYILVRRELRGQIDQQLQQNATTVATGRPNEFAMAVSPHVYEILGHAGPFVGYYQLISASGNAYVPDDLIDSGPLPVTAQAIAVAAGRVQRAYYYDTEFQGQDTRVLTIGTESSVAPGLAADQRFAIQVVESLAGVDHELARLRLWLFLVALAGVALAAGAGFLVARSTLRPVRDLSQAAERVRATRDLSQRISVAGRDELSQLAHTFNQMLAALDEAAERQRRLVQDASHELRTPLTSLRTNIEVLANGGLLAPEDRSQLLHDVVEQLGEMTALVSELTALAQGEEQPLAPEEVRLDLLTEDAIRRTVRNHPDVAIEADLPPTSVVASAAGLERAVLNLLDNAAKWSPAGSPIEVRTDRGELTVRDHGPGIAPADVPHIFERFYRATTARSMPGSGLGLAIVKQVAEANGGSILCEETPGGGTLMRLRLPTPTQESAAPASSAAAAADESAVATPAGNGSQSRLAATRARLKRGTGSAPRAGSDAGRRRRRVGRGPVE